jgi:glycosyltransferase involved in cell wall biosynthesis
MIHNARMQMARRSRQLRKILSTRGIRGITDRIRTVIGGWILPKGILLPVESADVLASDLSHPPLLAQSAVKSGDSLVINWVMVPAGPQSGGHTTIFRIIRYLEARGYVNRIYFYNIHGADHEYYKSFTQSFYEFYGPVEQLELGMKDAHAVIATSWATAYPVFNSSSAGKRFYFVQDYEPYFYPMGAINLLAENTYRMGFHAITAGKWLSEKLSAEYGMTTDSFDFGCDTSVYSLTVSTKRTGLVFYARPDAPRRGFELGMMAMEIFATRRPDIDLHFYGDTMGKLRFPIIDHGKVPPKELNRIYNQCYGGLSLSLTNVSLVPHEMLAAGCIPVVNEAIQNRIVLDNLFVRYAPPNPHALASELEAVVNTPNFEELSRAASASVRGATWDDAGATVDGILRRTLDATR